MANVYVSSVAYAAVAQWTASTAYTVGQYVRQRATPAYGNERVFKCTTAGTSLSTEPTWNLGDGATTTESAGPVWTQVAGREAEQASGSWNAPFGTIRGAGNVWAATVTTTLLVSSDHVESQASAQSYGVAAWIGTYSVSRAGSVPPATSDYLRGAALKTTGNNALTITNGYWWGFDFTCGDSTSAATLQVGQGNNPQAYLEDCTLSLGGSGAQILTFGSTASFPGYTTLRKTNVNFAATTQTISFHNAQNLEWAGGAVGGSAVPASLFTFQTDTPPRTIKVHGVDFSACSGALLKSNSPIWGQMDMWDCKLHASATVPSMFAQDVLSEFRMVNCDDATNGRNYRYAHIFGQAQILSDAAVVRTGGASDGVTNFSHKIVPNNINGALGWHLAAPTGWISRRLNSVGSAVTLSLEAIFFPPTGHTLTDIDVWMEVEVLDTSGVPLGHLISTRGSPLGSGGSLTASTSAWDSQATSRANSTTYAAYSFIKASSNAGRVFMNDAGANGASASSLPGGFATAVDGGTVTDGSNTWTAGTRLKFSQSITPEVKGIVRARLVTRYTGSTNHTNIGFLDPKLQIV